MMMIMMMMTPRFRRCKSSFYVWPVWLIQWPTLASFHISTKWYGRLVEWSKRTWDIIVEQLWAFSASLLSVLFHMGIASGSHGRLIWTYTWLINSTFRNHCSHSRRCASWSRGVEQRTVLGGNQSWSSRWVGLLSLFRSLVSARLCGKWCFSDSQPVCLLGVLCISSSNDYFVTNILTVLRTIRAMISENSTPKTQARAFGYFAVGGNIGIFMGPLIGMSILSRVRRG